ncbi:uncharacterized protein J8A68_003366 [[Candida] subhashii]|uniref:Uncharacterized protein n=1 Tax=[Candida] subhashii TaxID=561895 RepID=A0A8J5UYI3_9ASCO|nr:uncharacterized protein J8A68_003366 [[Candida] subhashii]KAG7663094.1 hypothetical protein J8A68_003366 [[Candida] subhashii]
MQFKPLSLIFTSLLSLAAATTEMEYETTVTSLVTPVETAFSTVTAEEYIYGEVFVYVNDEGVETSETFLIATTTINPNVDLPTPGPESAPEPASTAAGQLVIPPGDYSTTTVLTDTVLDDGKTVALELVVYFTEEC